MKIAITLGATLNLGNYNSVRASVMFEDEFSERDISVMVEADTDTNSTREDIINAATEALYKQVEYQLLDKITKFIDRLDDEKVMA